VFKHTKNGMNNERPGGTKVASSQKILGLEWLVSEVDANLAEACEALDIYAKNNAQDGQLRFCLDYIHQVTGSLKITQCYGGALLSEEMEAVIDALLSGATVTNQETIDVLSQSVAEVPRYLRKCIESGFDQPALLLTILNELRALRNAPLASSSQFFKPDLSMLCDPLPFSPGMFVAKEQPLQEFTNKLSQLYQYALLGYVKNEDQAENINKLAKVLYRLKEITLGSRLELLWRVAGSVLECLSLGVLDKSRAIHSLFWELGACIRQLSNEGTGVFEDNYPDNLLKNLLYYVTIADPESSPRLRLLREEFKLDQALPSGVLAAADGGFVPCYEQSVVTQVNALADGLSESAEVTEFVTPALTRIGDTLAMVGQPKLRDSVSEVGLQLQEMLSNDDKPGVEQLSQIATRLVGIDVALDTWAANYRPGSIAQDQLAETAYLVDAAHYSLIREVRNNLETIKDAVVGYISSQWDTNFLQDIPELIQSIGGAMALVKMERPARVVTALGDYLNNELIASSSAPGWDRLDLLADTITAFEHFLEVVMGDAGPESQEPLNRAENALLALGYMSPDDKVRVDIQHPGMDLDQGAVIEESASTAILVDTPQDVISDNEALEQVVGLETNTDDELDAIDEEIVEIFVEEAREILENLEACYPQWLSHREDDAALGEVRRNFHSLKGSGRMVHALHIGELGFVVEDLFNKVIDGKLVLDSDGEGLVARVIEALPVLIGDFEARRQSDNQLMADALIRSVEAFKRGELESEFPTEAPALVAVDSENGDDQTDDTESKDVVAQGGVPVAHDPGLLVATESLSDDGVNTPLDMEENSDTELDQECTEEPPSEPIQTDEALLDLVQESAIVTESEADFGGELDRELINIFIDEARHHIAVLANFIDELKQPSSAASRNDIDTLRALHMLKGSACVADIVPVAELATMVEKLVKDITRSIIRIDDELIVVLQDTLPDLSLLVEASGDINSELAARGETAQQRLEAIRSDHRVRTKVGADILALNAMLTSGLECLIGGEELLNTWQAQPAGRSNGVVELCEELAVLATAAEMAQCHGLRLLARQYADGLEACNNNYYDADKTVFTVFYQANECLLDMIDSFVAEQIINPAPESLINGLKEIIGFSEVARPEIAVGDHEFAEAVVELGANESATGTEMTDHDVGPEVIQPNATEPKIDQIESDQLALEQTANGVLEQTVIDEAIDPEIIAIFIEEAEELLERIEKVIQVWREAPADNVHQETLARELHTFKGGARVGGFKALGDMSHDFETYIDSQAMSSGDKPLSFFDDLLKRHDELAALFDQAKLTATPDNGDTVGQLPGSESLVQDSLARVSDATADLAEDLPAAGDLDTGSLREERSNRVRSELKPVATTQLVSPGGDKRVVQPFVEREPRTVPVEAQEMVKISASAIDDLVNLAGETSITRARVEQNVNEFSQYLDEMEATVTRLQEQVRRMGHETEAQISFRREQIESSDDSNDFDPLELDRYSQFQHLFSALQESASDLQEVKETLVNNAKSAELSLAQQSHVTTDLQESLMLTRLVPFTRLVPRLRRVMRQAANELGKSVTLKLDNVDGDLDRTVLGKIVGPLEHMIRNAVDHGLEDAETRQIHGKPAEGKISLSFGRESSEITIRVTDDGKGLDVDAIRKRAVSRGLIADNTQVGDQELRQLIFMPGFSTSDTISQLSGRGVGLDVVVTEVRQLGGSINVFSEPGLGTEFNIRVPFTLSVNRALMIRSGNERYALPLNTIVGVVQMTVTELTVHREDPARQLYYGGEGYRICTLSHLLGEYGDESTLAVDGKAELVLVATENHRFAVQVESLEGSQEIAIKSLGTVFNRVAGLSGVTIMGDGRVVVILDLVTLLRAQGAMDLVAQEGQLMACEQATSEYEGQKELIAVGGDQVGEFVELRGRSTRTIMVVDDSVTVRKVTTRFLEREGFDVVTAKDGVDAVDMLNDLSPDLMLLDIEMPRMDGFDVARVVRNHPKLSGLPIVMISSRSGSKHRDKAAACGVNYFLGKPYREEELLGVITEILGVQASR
jgi:chemosensory pili system protein ChpA (sensor histidine kinase/response regulator)